MTIAFLCNKELTVPFEAIGRHLRAAGERIVWLSPSTRWADWLKARGWPAGDILNLATSREEWRGMAEEEARAILAPFEHDPSVTAAHIVRMCRGLMYIDRVQALGYLAVTVREVSAFLDRHDVAAVLGEGTWGFEMATWLVAEHRGIRHMNPALTRLPGDRFCLVDAMYGSLVAPRETSAEQIASAEDFYRRWIDQPRAAPGVTLPSLSWAWVGEFGRAVGNRSADVGDETLWPIGRRMRDRAKRLNRAREARVWLKRQPAPPDAPYVLFPLHHQPEAAIDALGGFHSDQLHLIETLVRMLPATHRLHIREHRAALGDRSLAWYRDVARLPGVHFVDPHVDIWPQMKASAATITVCGTVLFEAALLGVPALGLGPVHFAELFAVTPTRMSSPLEWPLADILDPAQRERWTPGEPARIAYLARLFANSGLGDAGILRAPEAVLNDPHWLAREADWLRDQLTCLRASADPFAHDRPPRRR